MDWNEKPVRLFIVIPCYNEQEVLPLTAPMFREELRRMTEAGRITEDSRVLFVNDGSRDDTWKIIQDLSRQDPHFQGLCLSRNRGHQNALLCGLMASLSISMQLSQKLGSLHVSYGFSLSGRPFSPSP